MTHQSIRTSLVALASAAHLFLANPTSAQSVFEDLKLTAANANAEDFFGYAVAINNGVIAVGADLADPLGFFSGTAYLYDATTGVQLHQLVPSDGGVGHQFGWSIAIQDGLVAVGAVGAGSSREGAVYIFDVNTGNQLRKLVANDGTANDQFGNALAISNGLLVVGTELDDDAANYASGSAYIFDLSTGTQLFKLTANDAELQNFFGCAVAIENNLVAIGARANNDNGTASGSVYLFDATTGLQLSNIYPDDPVAWQGFGWDVGIDNGTIAVSAYKDETNGANSGAVYLFDSSTELQFAKITPDDGAEQHYFGQSISIDNGLVAVGANGHTDSGVNSGAAYVFSIATAAQVKLLASDGDISDNLGFSIAMENGIVASGAYLNDQSATNAGAVYVFDIDCPADLNGDFAHNFIDISAFISLMVAQDPAADFNNDGLFNFFDVSAFLSAYAVTCP